VFKRYGCGCIGIPYHSTTDYKEESAMCVSVCEGVELEEGSLVFTSRTFTDDGERDQLRKAKSLSPEESEVLAKRLSSQLYDGDKFRAMKRWFKTELPS